MAFKVIKMCCGGGPSIVRSTMRGVGKSGNGLFMGSIVLLLAWCFVGQCGGKPFHSVGQAEVEEDTTQGTFKEKFPSISEIEAATTDDADMLAKMGLVSIGNDYKSRDLMDSKHFRHIPQPSTGHPYNYGVQKRSLIGGLRSSPYSSDLDEDDDFQEKQQRLMASAGAPPPRSISDPAFSAPDAISSPPETSPGFRIRQKLLNLRNQYGDKWFALVSPYAYRKRQILYRQCFFNPISCF